MIDATLVESMLDIVGPGSAIAHRTGQSDGRIGSRLCFSAPRNVYECSDGWICIWPIISQRCAPMPILPTMSTATSRSSDRT